MAITIRIGDEANKKLVTLEMDVRKSLNGDLMIFDHGDIDIVLSSAKNKVVVFPKEIMSDYVYGAQNRLFTFLRKRGILIPESIQAGSFYGSFEGTIETPKNEDVSGAKMALLNEHTFAVVAEGDLRDALGRYAGATVHVERPLTGHLATRVSLVAPAPCVLVAWFAEDHEEVKVRIADVSALSFVEDLFELSDDLRFGEPFLTQPGSHQIQRRCPLGTGHHF